MKDLDGLLAWQRRTALACGMLETAADTLPSVSPSTYACLASQLRVLAGEPSRGSPGPTLDQSRSLVRVLGEEHDWLVAETDEIANLLDEVANDPDRIAPEAIGYAIAGQLRAMRSHRRWIDAVLHAQDEEGRPIALSDIVVH